MGVVKLAKTGKCHSDLKSDETFPVAIVGGISGTAMLLRKVYVVIFSGCHRENYMYVFQFARISEGTRWRCRMCNGFSRACTHNAVARQAIF